MATKKVPQFVGRKLGDPSIQADLFSAGLSRGPDMQTSDSSKADGEIVMQMPSADVEYDEASPPQVRFLVNKKPAQQQQQPPRQQQRPPQGGAQTQQPASTAQTGAQAQETTGAKLKRWGKKLFAPEVDRN